jgi:hypothetical protein
VDEPRHSFFYFTDGKIAKMDARFDIENPIKKIEGTIQPAAARLFMKKNFQRERL